MDDRSRKRNEHVSREEYPTGWFAIAKHNSVAKIIDALLDLPPHREFTQTELADLSDVSRQSVANHLDFLLDIGVIERVENTRPQRYRFDPDHDVSQAIIQLDGAMNRVGPYAE